MADHKLERVLQSIDPEKRLFIKKLVAGTAFAVPVIASYSVNELAQAAVGSPTDCTTTLVSTTTSTQFTTSTTTTTRTTTTTTTVSTATTTI